MREDNQRVILVVEGEMTADNADVSTYMQWIYHDKTQKNNDFVKICCLPALDYILTRLGTRDADLGRCSSLSMRSDQ